MSLIPQYLIDISEQLVSIITFGQLDAIRVMYDQWLSVGVYNPPNILAYIFAVLIVVIRFAVPIILVYYLIIKNIFKNIYLQLISVSVVIVVYALFYFNPIELFNEAVNSINKFYYFLLALPGLEYEPFLFVGLTNGLYIFIIRAIFVFVCIWVFFIALIGLSTLVFWIISAGKSPWQFTDKDFKAFTLQLALAFLIFYPLLGAFRTFMTILALIIGSIEFKEAFYTIRGYEKVCFNEGNQVICRWGK